MKNKYPLQINQKNLPNSVKQAWYYGGKYPSIHLILNPIMKEIDLGNGLIFKFTTQINQINININ